MLNNKKIILSLVISLFIGVVHAEKKPDEAYQKELDRITALDVTEQVQKDVEEKRFQLYVYSNRGGTQMPGIDLEVRRRFTSLCEKVVMQDYGDVVYSQVHLKYMAAYFDYAYEYNKQMERFCIN